MATGRIGTTPVLRTRWSKEPAGGTTSLSGLDDYSVSLVYEVGYEAVYQNGALLSRGNDYTATNGTTITLTNATVAGDIIEVFANNVVPLTDTYSQSVADGKFVNNTIVDAKGDLIVGSAADTFVRLPVGSNGQVLTAASTTGTGLAWSAPQSMTLLSTTTLSGGTVSITDISGSYKRLIAFIYGVTNATANGIFRVAPNNNTTGSSYVLIDSVGAGFVNSVNRVTQIHFGTTAYARASSNNCATLIIDNYANSTNYKPFTFYGFAEETGGSVMSFHGGGAFVSNTAITRLDFQNSQGSLLTGTVLLYGVN